MRLWHKDTGVLPVGSRGFPNRVRGTLAWLAAAGFLACGDNNPVADKRHAEVILEGAIQHRVDDVAIHHYSGSVRNIGDRRADFVVVKLVWSPGIVDSSFIHGDSYTYRDGTSARSALFPGSRGVFEVASARVGNYTVKIGWQELD